MARPARVRSTPITKPRSPVPADQEMGRRIRLRRVELRMSQTDLGQKLGVTFQQVQKYEKGVNRVGATRLQAIATALDAPMAFFFPSGTSAAQAKQTEVDSLLFLDSTFSLRLLRAYTRIGDQRVQRHLVSLMEAFAGTAE